MKYILTAHIASGILALVLGLFLLLLPKGTRTHKLLGRIYFAAICVICFSGLYIARVRELTMLEAIGVFSFYLAWSGYRAGQSHGYRAGIPEIVVLVLLGIASARMLWSGDTVLLVFGGIGVWSIITDIRLFRRQVYSGVDRRSQLLLHIGRIIGSYIAVVTAYLVNNGVLGHGIAAWLGPTVVGVPLIILFSRKSAPAAVRS